MKVILLDIDGVLITAGNYEFSKAACKNLNLLLNKEPELRVVVSSSWRKGGLKQIKLILNNNGIDQNKIIDITGNERGERGVQVRAWLDRNPEVTNYVCIDDDTDFSGMMDHLVKTNSFVGLTEKDIEKALDILKK